MHAGDQMEFAMPGTFHLDGPGHGSDSPTMTGVHPGLFRPPVSPSETSSMHLTKSTLSMRSDSATPIANAKRKRSRPSYRGRESTPLNDWTMAGENNTTTAAPNATTTHPVHTSATRSRFQQPHCGISNITAAQEEADVDLTGGVRHYILAGQLDTPNGGASRHTDTLNGALDDSTYSDADYRRELGSKRHCEATLGDGPTPPLSFTENSNEPPANSQGSDWSKLALNAIGGVVGRVWEFCKTGAFRGFHAGGGLGYDVNGTVLDALDPDSRDNPHNYIYRDFDTPMDSEVMDALSMPASDYNPYTYEGQSTPESTPPPAAKRRQVNNSGEELRRNWVIVTEPPSSKLTPSGSKVARASHPQRKRVSGPFVHHSPASSRSHRASAAPSRVSMGPRYCTSTTSSSGRRISVPVSRLSQNGLLSSASTVGGGGGGGATNSSHRRASSRASTAGGMPLGTREPASFASSRSPNPSPTIRRPRASTPSRREHPAPYHPIPRTPSRIPVINPNLIGSPSSSVGSPSQTGKSRMQSPSGAGGGHMRSQSRASTGSMRGKKKNINNKPAASSVVEQSPRLTGEAVQLATKRLVAEREVDARMNAFNRSLQDMIRQGKEALGTTVEVEFLEGEEREGDGSRGGVGDEDGEMSGGGYVERAVGIGPGGWVDE